MARGGTPGPNSNFESATYKALINPVVCCDGQSAAAQYRRPADWHCARRILCAHDDGADAAAVWREPVRSTVRSINIDRFRIDEASPQTVELDLGAIAASLLGAARRGLTRHPDAGILPHLLASAERAQQASQGGGGTLLEPLTQAELRVLELAPTSGALKKSGGRCPSRRTRSRRTSKRSTRNWPSSRAAKRSTARDNLLDRLTEVSSRDGPLIVPVHPRNA